MMKSLEDYDPGTVTRVGMTIAGCFIIIFKLVVFIFFEEKNIATWMILLLILMLGIFVIVNGRAMATKESDKEKLTYMKLKDIFRCKLPKEVGEIKVPKELFKK